MIYTLKKDTLEANCPEFNFEEAANEIRIRAKYLAKITPALIDDKNLKLMRASYYSLDGSLVTSLDSFTKNAPDFFQRSRRVVFYRGKVHLRGGRYTMSANPTFELRQKLDCFREDLDEGLEAILIPTNSFYQLAIADFVKNAVLTMFNSFLHEEKTGKYRFSQVTYQSIRKDALAYAQHAIDFYYGILLQDTRLTNTGYIYLKNNKQVFDKIQSHILDEYKRGVFSSRHITRPEVSHPMVIALSVARYLTDGEADIDTIVGLPSGSTELSLAHATGQKWGSSPLC